MLEDRTLPIVIVGHIDHGKSSLIGRLLYDTRVLSPEKASEIQSKLENGEHIEFAHLIDYLEEERLRGMTIDTSQIFFKTNKRRYVVIDAPGHREFIKNMVTGSSQAEAALLIIDANEGIMEQTRRHGYVLKILGLKQICVLVNKMDMVDYSMSRFVEIKAEVDTLLSELDAGSHYTIPISAQKGDNIASPSLNMNWYNGPTVLEALDDFSALEIESKPLRFPVQDVYKLNGKTIAVGRVEAGSMSRGQTVIAFPRKEEATISTIEKFLEAHIQTASTGECVGLCLNGNSVTRGEVLVEASAAAFPAVAGDVKANIFWMVEDIYSLGEPLVFKCVTQEIPCSISTVYRRFDPAFIEVVDENPNEIKVAQVAEVKIQLESPAVLDRFNEFPEMGRFVLEQAGQPVAGGVIL